MIYGSSDFICKWRRKHSNICFNIKIFSGKLSEYNGTNPQGVLKKKKSKETKQKEKPSWILRSSIFFYQLRVMLISSCYLSFPFPVPPTIPLKNQKDNIQSCVVWDRDTCSFCTNPHWNSSQAPVLFSALQSRGRTTELWPVATVSYLLLQKETEPIILSC